MRSVPFDVGANLAAKAILVGLELNIRFGIGVGSRFGSRILRLEFLHDVPYGYVCRHPRI